MQPPQMSAAASGGTAAWPATGRIDDHAEHRRVPLLVQVIGVARKRKWMLIGIIAASLLLGLIATLLATPQYTATSTIEIQREVRNFTNVAGAEADQNAAIDQEFYQTQYGLLQSRTLAERVAQELRVADDVKFFRQMGSEYTKRWFDDDRLIPGASTREQRIREVGDLLLKQVKIRPERLSRLVEISFSSPDPAFSKRVVDTWGTHFIRVTLERRYETTSYARKFLETRLAQLRQRIDESERQLVNYASKEGIVTVPTTDTSGQVTSSTGAERPLLSEDLATLNRELTKATADRVLAESRLSGTGGTVTEGLQNQGISDIRATRATLQAQYAKMLEQFEPSYPPAQALRSQIQQLDRSIATEEGRVTNTLRESYRAARQREDVLTRQVTQLKSGVLDLRRRSIQYNIFQRDADTNRQLYDALLQRYKEIGVAGGVGVNNISIVDAAELPRKPSSPRLLVNLVVALLFGIVTGGAVAFLLEQIDEGITDPGEIQDLLGEALLGTIPKVTTDKPVTVLADPKSPLSEAYFSLQTNLSFATDHGFPRSMAVISSRPAEGKSLTAIALAKSLQRSGRKVLLIDGDMRSPSVHYLMQIDGGYGLSNYLTGTNETAALIQAGDDGLHAMAAGPQPPSAAELLASDRLDRLLAELLGTYDCVIIDSPPVLGLADAPLVSSRVEGCIFVTEAHSTKKGVVRVALSRLRAARANVFGIVLTKFDSKRAHYGYGYNYGYGYGYGADGAGSEQ